MNVRKTGIAIAVSALMASGVAWADSNDAFGSDDVASHNQLLSDNTTTVLTDASSTSDTDTYTTTTSDTDLLSNNDTETNLLSNNETDTDLLSNNTDNSVNDSGNTSNSAQWADNSNTYNTDNSMDLDLDADIIVTTSVLDGSVSGVGVNYGGGFVSAGVSVSNMNSLDGMSGAAGIVTVSQNSGANSLTQQAVTTNASLFAD